MAARGILIRKIKSFYREKKKERFKTSLEYYRLIRLLGKGSFGKVHLAIHVLSGRRVAIKCIEKSIMSIKSNKDKIWNEINLH